MTRARTEKQVDLAGVAATEPAERRQHDEVTTVPTERAGVCAMRVETQRSLDRYRKRGLISERQYRAGDRLYQTWMQAAAPQVRTTDFSIRVDGGGGTDEET